MTPPQSDAAPPDPVTTDPMLRVLHERHPEVDIVVLPQPVTAPVAPEVDALECDALALALARSLDELLARVAPDPGTTPTARDGRWRHDEFGLTWFESTAVVGPLDRGGNVAMLRATAQALIGLGWQARPVPGDRPRIVGRRRGGLEAAATVRPDSLVLSLRTPRVRVREEEAS